jgi:Histidine kinase-, DNA gyrase B-, and HSP90-like ATPase
VLVTIRDSGLGIDLANLGRVFEAFYTTEPSGVGMGLAICRSIIDAHGGRLWVDANGSRGAVFRFILPSATEDLWSSSNAKTFGGAAVRWHARDSSRASNGTAPFRPRSMLSRRSYDRCEAFDSKFLIVARKETVIGIVLLDDEGDRPNRRDVSLLVVGAVRRWFRVGRPKASGNGS